MKKLLFLLLLNGCNYTVAKETTPMEKKDPRPVKVRLVYVHEVEFECAEAAIWYCGYYLSDCIGNGHKKPFDIRCATTVFFDRN